MNTNEWLRAISWIVMGIMMEVLAAVFGIYLPLTDSGNGVVYFIVGLMFGVPGFFIIQAPIEVIKTQKEEQEKQQKQRQKYEDARFYMACFKASVPAMDSTADRERARLIARRFVLMGNMDNDSGIRENFEKSKEAAVDIGKAYYLKVQNQMSTSHENLDHILNKEYIAKEFAIADKEDREAFYKLGDNSINTKEVKIAKDKNEQRQKERFAGYYGRDKRIAILQEKIWECERSLGNTKYLDADTGTMKEKDWAVAGGIATGLAGGAAGVATALDVQRHNAEVRDYNAQVRSFTASLNHIMYEQERVARSNLSGYKHELEHAQSVLVSDMKMEQLKPYVRIKEETLSKRETGTIDFKIKLESKRLPAIYENKSTVLDGVVRADFCYNGEVKGTAYVPLTTYGLRGSSTMECDGMCAGLDSDKDYTMNLSFKSLWLMEA